MNRTLAFASLISVLCISTVALADEGPADDGKKIGVGGDVQFVLPLGDFGDVSGPQIGPLLRIGYRVAPAFEITGRVGYLHGLSKDQMGLKTSISNIPVWLGGRYFFMEPGAGAYGAAEVGMNNMSSKVEGTIQTGFGAIPVSGSSSATRFGFNVGAGYVISKDLPIDIRAQFMHHNLLGTEGEEKAILGLGISAGYTASF